ncbi:pyridoxal phosphate-dependent transferase [Mycena maculata]|uniref:Pyridoxal phosphate-dependent transferase n=1 Tax=Mycena maculata TaxID=230809 RepID=A0AAD7HMJ8_9AGAR|nr:pyridoxal phosphate-dependent transferase [Mycena maculata]
MQAVWRSHKLLAGTIGSNCDPESRKVAHVNLLYCDSYKFLELTSSAGYHFFSNDTIDKLEALLATGTPENPAIMALYTDFPGNPHLRSAGPLNIPLEARSKNSWIHSFLSAQILPTVGSPSKSGNFQLPAHDFPPRPDFSVFLDYPRMEAAFSFPIIIDETVTGYLNTQMLPYCDVVVSSLTKLFSGLANVLGGAMLLNPSSRFYPEFKAYMEATYEDSFFDSDALVMEMNSREFTQRTRVVNNNAEKLSDMLYARSVVGGLEGGVLQAVHYPKYRTRENFERCRNPFAAQAGLEAPGYGCLLSVTFKSLAAAKAFYNALQCYKGPTLGTVYTLAIAFTAMAYPPDKMDWIKARGVEENLVRFSVGMEDTSSLLKCVSDALEVAEKLHSALPDKKNGHSAVHLDPQHLLK